MKRWFLQEATGELPSFFDGKFMGWEGSSDEISIKIPRRAVSIFLK
jgi:hypothetical protein